jgi:hypothetical protein
MFWIQQNISITGTECARERPKSRTVYLVRKRSSPIRIVSTDSEILEFAAVAGHRFSRSSLSLG